MAVYKCNCQSCFHKDICENYHPQTRTCDDYVNSADVVEAKHGEWVWKSNGYIKRLLCSCCNSEGDWPRLFCSSCGAKMDGERSNEDAE